MIWRFLPLTGTLLLAGIVGCWRPWLQFRRHGTWGVILFRSKDHAQLLRDSAAVILIVLLLWQATVVALWPESLSPVVAWAGLTANVTKAAGALLLFGGIALLVVAQLDLGAAWRIGIDEDARPGLVTRGLYRLCRNPIFVALLVAFAGYALLVPTLLSFALLAGGVVAVRQQTLAEEAYLLRTYPEAFREYAARVGRFLPGIGKLR